MEKFYIYGYTNLADKSAGIESKTKEVIITDSEHLSRFSTFDEDIKVGENDKLSFSFSIMEKVNGERNPFLDLMNQQSVIALHLPEREQETSLENGKEGAFYLLKIVERSPSFHKESLMYTITCEDYASQVYSRQGVGLTLDMTGSLRELAEEILGQTRKNNLFKELNRDISSISYRKANTARNAGIKYELPYINFKGESMGDFISSTNKLSYVSFIGNDKFTVGEKYDLHFDLVALNNTYQNTTNPFQVLFQVVGVAADGTEIEPGQLVASEFNGNAKALRVPFTYREGMEFLELRVVKDIDEPWPESGIYTISLTGFKITKNREKTESREVNNSLIISRLENFYTDFTTSNGSYYSETKMTFSISNSNLYHSLVSLATLFNAEVKFDYQYNSFYFVSKEQRRYKGLSLHPEINLSSISRPETSTEFATVLHLQGSGDIEGAIPPLPKEWRQFLSECVDRKFINTTWFKDYNSIETYLSKVPKVAEYINKDDSLEERMNEIKKFAAHMDKIPNFESTIYDFSYFRRRDMLTSDQYSAIIKKIYEDVRKTNIALNINTYRYYSLYSDHSTQLLQLSFYISAINTERRFQYNTKQKLNSDDAPDMYTSAWISYMNQIDASVAAEQNYLRELDIILGLKADGHLNLEPGSFAYNTLMVFGYETVDKNGIQKLLKTNKDLREAKSEELRKLVEEITNLESQLNDPLITTFVKESLAVDLAGVRRKADDMSRLLGIVGSPLLTGIYNIEFSLYEELLARLKKYPSDVQGTILAQDASLYDLVINRESQFNLVNKKEKELQFLLTVYEPFTLEARYENSDEITAFGLLEQGLKSFVGISSPKVNYNISAIHIGALKGYEYISHPEIGDKIKLPEDLFLDYSDIETEPYLVVNGFSEKLRQPDSLSLDVERQDESEKLVARLLEETNFVKIGEQKKKSNFVALVPQELKDEIPVIQDSVNKIKESELSISSLYEAMIQK